MNHALRFHNNTYRLEKMKKALANAIKLKDISTRYAVYVEEIEGTINKLEERRKNNFHAYTNALIPLGKHSHADLDKEMKEVHDQLSDSCEKQLFSKLSEHIDSYRNTQHIDEKAWQKDLQKLAHCAPE